MNDAFFNKRPAVRIALLVAFGILLSHWFPISPLIWYCVSATTFLCSLILLTIHRPHVFALFLQLSIVTALSSYHAFDQQEVKEKKIIPMVPDEQVSFRAAIDSDPEIRNERFKCIVKTDRVDRAASQRSGRFRISLSVPVKRLPSSVRSVSIGDSVLVSGVLRDFPKPRNPGELDYGRFLELNDIQGIVTVRDSVGLQVLQGTHSITFASLVSSLQRSLYHVFDRLHGPEGASFLKGIVLGYRGDLSDEVKQSFVDTGTIHILAVSGSNVAVVWLVFASFFGFFRMNRRITAAVAMAALVVYMFVTGASASVERATLMAIVLMSASLFERKADIYNSLSVAALILLILNPNTLFDVGFQLSFAAVLSIVFFYPKLEELIKLIPERFEEIKAVDYLLKLFAVSLAAQIGTIPFTAYYFGRISIVSLLANLVVVPISGLNTLLGLAELAFAPISMTIASLYAGVNDVLIWFLLGFVKMAASVPYAVIETAKVSVSAALIYYIVMVLLFEWKKPQVFKPTLVLLLVALNGVVFSGLFASDHSVLRITMIDVGQGDAILIESTDGAKILVDAGPISSRVDAGERVIIPFLKTKGITDLDALIVSHPHADHIGGAPAIVKSIKVRKIIQARSESGSKLYQSMMKLGVDRQVEMEYVKAGDRLDLSPDVRFYVLHPRLPNDSTHNLNNASVAFRLVYGKTSALFVGDSETEVEEKLMARYAPMLRSDLLKSGHHGSITSSGESFVGAVSPKTLLVSVGTKNKFNHPSAAVLDRFRAIHTKILRTDLEGALVFESDGMNWRQINWRNQE